MAGMMGRTMLAPLLVLNLIMYIVVVGFASWNLNHFINGQTNYPGVAGNGATFYFLVFAILAGVVGAASKLAGIHHVRSWRGDTLADSAASALIAWAITALAFGLACEEIHIGGHRGCWRPSSSSSHSRSSSTCSCSTRGSSATTSSRRRRRRRMAEDTRRTMQQARRATSPRPGSEGASE
ncbi:hypothetical protein PVAP13_9NG018700 [Panicum virgatum]|uniref:Uncharacterized protein n=1 Tax=Panicum virgatum TaxID=38727 RepID=A0A8T0MB95_PANVG|nr:hypothetical protein PVAP13_9NG018700 [Panicum virgatum]